MGIIDKIKNIQFGIPIKKKNLETYIDSRKLLTSIIILNRLKSIINNIILGTTNNIQYRIFTKYIDIVELIFLFYNYNTKNTFSYSVLLEGFSNTILRTFFSSKPETKGKINLKIEQLFFLMLHNYHLKDNVRISTVFLHRFIYQLMYLLYGYIIKILYIKNKKDADLILLGLQLGFLCYDKKNREIAAISSPLTQKSLKRFLLMVVITISLSSSIVMKLIQIRPVG